MPPVLPNPPPIPVLAYAISSTHKVLPAPFLNAKLFQDSHGITFPYFLYPKVGNCIFLF